MTKLTLVHVLGQSFFAHLPVDANGTPRITGADAVRLSGATPPRGGLCANRIGRAALNVPNPHNRLPFVSV